MRGLVSLDQHVLLGVAFFLDGYLQVLHERVATLGKAHIVPLEPSDLDQQSLLFECLGIRMHSLALDLFQHGFQF